MKYVSTLALITCLISFDASAQRMHDFSMDEQESLQQGTTRSNPSGNYQQFQNQQPANQNNPSFNPGLSGSSNYNTQLPGQPASRFMAGYCDPNFKPMLSNAGRIASMNACIETQKKQACDMFAQLPSDAQQVMDSSIGCVYNQANNGQMDENGFIVQNGGAQDCSAGDSQRINLLQRYWQQQNVAYAIVFLPDMVLNAPNRCMGNGSAAPANNTGGLGGIGGGYR